MTVVTKVTDFLYNTGVGKWLANPRASVGTAAAIATVSNVSKDAVNCAYYTYQSINNERIPESQRKFVGALDLANGLLNVALQIIMAFGIDKIITSKFDDKIAKTKPFSTDEKVIREVFEKLPEELKGKVSSFDEFAKLYKPLVNKGMTKMARIGFTLLAVNIAMQILTKRILTPLVATPLASVFKGVFEKQDEKKVQKENENKVVANA